MMGVLAELADSLLLKFTPQGLANLAWGLTVAGIYPPQVRLPPICQAGGPFWGSKSQAGQPETAAHPGFSRLGYEAPKADCQQAPTPGLDTASSTSTPHPHPPPPASCPPRS